jgi:hypothetical protein
MPTDLEQATGLERLEILGKMQGVDIFDLSPLDASRKGTYNLVERRRPSVFVLEGACSV